MREVKMAIISSEFATDKEYIHFNSAGIQSHKEDSGTVRPNGRSDYQILYIYDGLCRILINGEWLMLGSGNLVLFRPFDPQVYNYCKAEDAATCYLHFTGSGCEEIVQKIGFSDSRIINLGKSESIFALFEKTTHEAKMEHPFSQEICSALVLEILYRIGRKNIYLEDKTLLHNQSRIDVARRFMYENYSKDITREDCAKRCNLSVSRFSHIFKEVTGKSPAEFLMDIRMTKAEELLLSTNCSISEIGAMCGFPDSNYFSKTFKKYVGVSPKKYADSNQKHYQE